MQVYLLGAFQAIRNTAEAVSFRSDSERALLAYLAVESDRPHRRETLGALFWPETSTDQARNNLRVTLHRLKQALEAGDAAAEYLVSTRTELQVLPGETLRVDFVDLAGAIERTQQHEHADIRSCLECVADFAEAARLYRGEFLEGFSLEENEPFEDWVRAKREWAHRSVLNALYVLAEHALLEGDPAEAESYTREQLELEPWREKAHRQLMTMLALRGERPAALAQYAAYVEVLQEELGVGPSPEMESLYASIRAGSLEAPPGSPAPMPEPEPAGPGPEPVGPPPQVANDPRKNRLADLFRWVRTLLAVLLFAGGIFLILVLTSPIGSRAVVYDDFNDPAFDGSLDPARWFFPHALPGRPCVFAQAGGELALAADPATEEQACVLRVADPGTVRGNALGVMEVKMRTDSRSPGGPMGVALRASASLDDGDWNVDCALSITPEGLSVFYTISDTRLPPGQELRFSASTPVKFGDWHTVRVEVDSDTIEAVCMVDGEELGRYTPDETSLLAGAPFVRELLPWETEDALGVIRLDDFRIDAPAPGPVTP